MCCSQGSEGRSSIGRRLAAVAAGDDGWDLWRPMLVVAAFTAGALVLASLTLRRRTP